ncbi:MAG TPA: hypothetical protein VIR30_19265 [Nocardioides sp.]
MRKSLAVASLLLMVLVGGCGDKNTQVDATSAEPTPTTSGSGTPAPEQSSAITEQDFCDNIVEIFSMHDKKSGTDPLTDLMADGVPAEMPQDAKDGVQVIIDNSAKLNDPKAMVEAYRALPEGDRESVNALVQYVATACGTDIVKGLVALLPETVPEELRAIGPEDLPSELRGLLPSELPSDLEGIIPEDLATLIPEEWRSLIPEEYQDLFESPSASPSV